MIRRLANVIYWTASSIAAVVFLFGAFVASREEVYSPALVLLIFAIVAALVWLVGRGVRYVLAGPKGS